MALCMMVKKQIFIILSFHITSLICAFVEQPNGYVYHILIEIEPTDISIFFHQAILLIC